MNINIRIGIALGIAVIGFNSIVASTGGAKFNSSELVLTSLVVLVASIFLIIFNE